MVFVVLTAFLDEYALAYAIDKTAQTTAIFFVINILIVSAIIVSLMLYFVNSRNVANKNLQELNASLEFKVLERTAEMQEANDSLNNLNEELIVTVEQVQQQSKELSKKNKKITDSINYAKRIQSALLSHSDNQCTMVKDYFVLFKPRDIVSGDFYWFSCNETENKLIVAAVDCTGHGVPGAFMSLIGDSLLNKIVNDKEISSPEKILEAMDIGVQKTLNQNENDSRDGMDMAIAVIDFNNKKIEFAGAKSPLIYVRKNELFTIKGDIYSIGSKLKNNKQKVFKKHLIDFSEPITAYMFSDGFYDQLGGVNMRKYLSRNFKNTLLRISEYPMEKQQAILEHTFDNWKSSVPQTDDVLVIGMKLD